MKSAITISFWRKADTSRLARMIVIGLAVGVVGRWLYVTAPPLPVLAAAPKLSAASTNTPAPIKIEGASRSVRD